MPFYTYCNKKTSEIVETDFGLQTISEMEAYLKKNKHLDVLVTGTPMFSDMWRQGLKKPSDAFRDRLKDLKKMHRGSTINTWLILFMLGVPNILW